MIAVLLRRIGRVVEGARLESVYTARYRGFESHVLRHLIQIPFNQSREFSPIASKNGKIIQKGIQN